MSSSSWSTVDSDAEEDDYGDFFDFLPPYMNSDGDDSDSEDSDLFRVLEYIYLEDADESLTHTDQSSDDDELAFNHSYLKRVPANSPFKLLHSRNFQEFQKIIAKDKSLVNTQIKDGFSLLYLSILEKCREFFDFLLTLEEIDVNIVTYYTYCSPLMLASKQEDPYYVLELIKKCALLNVSNIKGDTALTLAIAHNNLKIAEILIENGADIDWQNESGNTALHVASLKKNHEAVALLLYYKADPSIRNYLKYNETAFDIALRKDHKKVQEILFDFIFDDFKVDGRLTSLVFAMITGSELFQRILKMTSEVIWDTPQLRFLFANLTKVDFKYLEMFISAFPCVFSGLIESFTSLHRFLELLTESNCERSGRILAFKADFHNFVCNFFDALLKNNIIESTNEVLIEICMVYRVPYVDLERTSLFFLSYGAELKRTMIEETFQYFGCTELLEIFLHMDIVDTKILLMSKDLLPALMYDPHLTLKEFLKKPEDFSDVSLSQVLKFSALPQFKQYCLRNLKDEVLHHQIKKMPDVPSLVELSRDASRSYIVDTFKIRNSRQYCTVIDRLDLPQIVKEFLLFWRPLYAHFFCDEDE